MTDMKMLSVMYAMMAAFRLESPPPIYAPLAKNIGRSRGRGKRRYTSPFEQRVRRRNATSSGGLI